MAFNLHLHQFKDKGASWITWAFYFASALLLALILSYGIFAFKTHLQQTAIDDIEAKISMYGTIEQKASEKNILELEQRIGDFAGILKNHKISLNVFNFIEQHTQPKIWFSSFDMSETTNDVRLVGTADTLEILSQQVLAFENQKEHVKQINILDSQVEASGKISFTLNLSLHPTIFTYIPPVQEINPTTDGN